MNRPSTIVRALAWSGLERAASSVVLLTSAVVIARTIGPEAFGLGSLALGLSFTFQLAAERVFHEAIVRRDHVTDEERNTAFAAALGVSLVLFALVVAVAGPVARVFDRPALDGLLRAASLSIPASGAAGVLAALMQQQLSFRRLAWRTLLGVVLGAAAGCGAAWAGAGASSVVVQNVVQAYGTLLASLVVIDRVPRPRLQGPSMRALARYGLLASGELVLHAGAFRVFVAIVGWSSGMRAVGHIELANRPAATLANLWTGAIDPVVLPLLSRLRDRRDALATAYARATGLNALVVLPLFAGVAMVADDLVHAFVGDAWLPASIALRVFAVDAALRLARQFSPLVFHAVGRPSFGLLGTAVGFVVANAVVLLTVPRSDAHIALAWTARLLVTIPLGVWLLGRVTGLSARAQLRPLFVPAVCTAGMVAFLGLMHAFALAGVGPLPRLVLEVLGGACVYAMAAWRMAPWVRDLARAGGLGTVFSRWTQGGTAAADGGTGTDPGNDRG